MSEARSRGLRPFFVYYGGKWRSAPRYPAPKHEVIVEPFAGSAGYALRYHERQVVLVEKDPVIAQLWRYLVAATAADLALPCPTCAATRPSTTWTSAAARAR